MKVSIALITYNQERFIEQAIESVLNQKTDFDYEIIIGEDSSDDDTRKIVLEYQREYPDIIRVLLQEENIGGVANDILVHKACTGQYIAPLEGDDFWISQDKLQRQVDFLDEHLQYPACFHAVEEFYDDDIGNSSISPVPNFRRDLYQEDLLAGTVISVCAIMYRSSVIDESFLARYACSVVGDYEFYILLSENGPVGYIDGILSAYRMHEGGIYTGATGTKNLSDRARMLMFTQQELAPGNDRLFRQLISRTYFDLAEAHFENGEPAAAKIYLLKSVRQCPLNPKVSMRAQFIIFVKACFQSWSNMVKSNRSRPGDLD